MTTLIGRRCKHCKVFSRPVLIGRGLGVHFCLCSLWKAQGDIAFVTFDNRSPVAIAAESHPFPSRTRKLSPPAPMVLGGKPPGRVGRRRILCDRGRPNRPSPVSRWVRSRHGSPAAAVAFAGPPPVGRGSIGRREPFSGAGRTGRIEGRRPARSKIGGGAPSSPPGGTASDGRRVPAPSQGGWKRTAAPSTCQARQTGRRRVDTETEAAIQTGARQGRRRKDAEGGPARMGGRGSPGRPPGRGPTRRARRAPALP
jgi:hypothetical protein